MNYKMVRLSRLCDSSGGGKYLSPSTLLTQESSLTTTQLSDQHSNGLYLVFGLLLYMYAAKMRDVLGLHDVRVDDPEAVLCDGKKMYKIHCFNLFQKVNLNVS